MPIRSRRVILSPCRPTGGRLSFSERQARSSCWTRCWSPRLSERMCNKVTDKAICKAAKRRRQQTMFHLKDSGDDPHVSKVFLSQKSIPVPERLIFALDVSSRAEAESWVKKLGSAVS